MANQPHKKINYNISLDTAGNGLTAEFTDIPEWFYDRMQTGMDSMDVLFGGTELKGWVAGTTLSISAAKGMGKTTGLMQILEAFHMAGKKVAYYSSEQTRFQLAFTAKRIGAIHVPLSSFGYIEDALEHAKQSKYDIIIFDSLQKFQTKNNVGKDQSLYVNAQIRQFSQDHNVATGIVLHRTKTGKTKGDSSIEHDVDINLEILAADPDLYPTSTRIWSVTKNRFGEDLYVAMAMTNKGFNWEEPVSVSNVLRTSDKKDGKKTDTRTERKNTLKENIMQLCKDEQRISVQFLLRQFDELDGNNIKARGILKDLVIAGQLVQFGRGMTAYWELADTAQEQYVDNGDGEEGEQYDD